MSIFSKIALVAAASMGLAALAEEPVRKPVSAPYGDKLVQEAMTAHAELKFIGLHVTPPGETDNLIVACSNPAKIGLVSTAEDMVYAEPKKAKVFSKANRSDREVDLWFGDASDRTLGMLVLHLDSPDIASDEAALRDAQAIQAELQKRIGSREQLFAGE